jgi:thymidine kinase
MFAGKTTHLLKRVQTLRSEGLMVQLVKPSVDDRYDRNSIVSHNQMKLPATVVDMLADVPEAIGPERWKRADVVGIDEGQFFPDLEATVRDWVDKHDKHVLVYGLKGSHTRRAFGEMHKLLANADKFEMLEAKCKCCGAPAPHSVKLEGDQRVVEVVGGKEMYAAVCRYHYNMQKSSGTISSQANQAGQEGSVV